MAKPTSQEKDPLYMSIADYFVFAEQSEIKHEYARGRVYAMSGGSVSNAPLKYKSNMHVMHPSFGVGTVIEIKRVDGKEIMTVAFENKKFGIKKLNTEFAQMTTL